LKVKCERPELGRRMSMTDEQNEKIRRMYEYYCNREINKPYDEYNPEIIQVILEILDIQGHKVKGVNA